MTAPKKKPASELRSQQWFGRQDRDGFGRNPVTGEEHRARINLPNGFEYDTCEAGRGWAETKGPIALSTKDSHAHFTRLLMTESGVVH